MQILKPLQVLVKGLILLLVILLKWLFMLGMNYLFVADIKPYTSMKIA